MDKLNNVTNRVSDWQLIDWKAVGETVQSLRSRIFVARKEGRMKDLKNLQKLMLRNRANWLMAIRRVTQINQGRKTPGVDREVITTPEERVELFYWLETLTINEWNPPPTRRVQIPKANGKKRPLGIPTIRDRIIQAIVKNALEPEWEAIFEPNSYGFRPGRSAHDAVVSIWVTYAGDKGNTKDWILDADIKGAFDNISHDYLLDKLGYFPAKPLIRKWLKAGVMIGLDLTPTDIGTPQGGIISPLLANIALHGMDDALGIVHSEKRIRYNKFPYKMVRYADDFVILCKTEDYAIEAKRILTQWLAEIGLEMSAEKTSITNIDDGFDFLGFTIRRRKTGRNKKGTSVHTIPSKANTKKFKDKVRHIFAKNLHRSPERLIWELNPLITGWGNYFRIGVSSKTFSTLDMFVWHRTWRYCKRRHPNKGAKWLIKKYYTTVRKAKWVFYDESTDIKLRRLSKIGISRHTKVKGTASPDDPNLSQYWEIRQRTPKGLSSLKTVLWRRQKGKCTHCNQWLGGNEELEAHHLNGNRNDNRLANLQLIHNTCHVQITTKRVRQQDGLSRMR